MQILVDAGDNAADPQNFASNTMAIVTPAGQPGRRREPLPISRAPTSCSATRRLRAARCRQRSCPTPASRPSPCRSRTRSRPCCPRSSSARRTPDGLRVRRARAQRGKSTTIDIPDDVNVSTPYFIAGVKDSGERRRARRLDRPRDVGQTGRTCCTTTASARLRHDHRPARSAGGKPAPGPGAVRADDPGRDRARIPGAAGRSRSSCARRGRRCGTSLRLATPGPRCGSAWSPRPISLGFCIVLGIPLAWLLARVQFRGRSLVRALVTLPLVLPPVVGGVALLMAFGRNGIVGQYLDEWFGITLPFTTPGSGDGADVRGAALHGDQRRGRLPGVRCPVRRCGRDLGRNPMAHVHPRHPSAGAAGHRVGRGACPGPVHSASSAPP